MAATQMGYPEVQDAEKKAGFAIGGFLLGMLAGAVVGGVAVLLLAPRSGKETRDIIMGKVSETQQMLQEQASNVKEKVTKARDAMRSTT